MRAAFSALMRTAVAERWLLLGWVVAVALLALQSLPSPFTPKLAADDPAAGPTTPPATIRVPGSARKVCQLTGEVDRERQQTTDAQTQTRAGLVAADLGIPVDRGDHLFIYFGDSGSAAPQSDFRSRDADSIAYLDSPLPTSCAGLTFVTAPDGGYLPPQVPGVSLGSFEVPTGGFSLNGSVYVFFATDSAGPRVMSRSVLAHSIDGIHFSVVRDVSRDKFINVAPVLVNGALIRGLPANSEAGVLLWASGRYHESDPYLAWVPLSSLESGGTWYYFAGLSPGGVPQWSIREADAAPLFRHPCIGELSVDWNAVLHSWVMLYNCIEGPRGIVYRLAVDPWGPWSPPAALFEPLWDGGFCHFIHVNWNEVMCDTVADPGRDYEWGGEYGPYIISRYTTDESDVDVTRTTIYFTMSTWNPYQTVLMRATLQTRTDLVPRRPPPVIKPRPPLGI